MWASLGQLVSVNFAYHQYQKGVFQRFQLVFSGGWPDFHSIAGTFESEIGWSWNFHATVVVWRDCTTLLTRTSRTMGVIQGQQVMSSEICMKSNAPKGAFSGSTKGKYFSGGCWHFIHHNLPLIAKLADQNCATLWRGPQYYNYGQGFHECGAQVSASDRRRKFVSKSNAKRRRFQGQLRKIFSGELTTDISTSQVPLMAKLADQETFHATRWWRDYYATDQDITNVGPRSGQRKW
jgi:hypothetical protein